MSLRHLLPVLTLLGSLTAPAQQIADDPDQSIRRERVPRWVVKLAPLSLFDPDNTIQVGLERRLGSRHALQGEFGYGWQGMNLWQNNQSSRYSDREVWRGRAEYRYYLGPPGGPIGQYVAVEGFYKQVNARESGTVGIGCETGNCRYYRLFSDPVSKYVWGGHIKFGRQFSLTPNDRLLFDIYVGLGFRRSRVERTQLASGVYYYGSAGYTLFDAFSPRNYAAVSVAYGFKIGYAL